MASLGITIDVLVNGHDWVDFKQFWPQLGRSQADFNGPSTLKAVDILTSKLL
jgi:hypothetical protein